jgi:Protein kinase domain/Tetratricopeptide repeat
MDSEIALGMVSKSRFTSKLTRDPRQRAETYQREGKTQKAAEMFAQAGDFRRAARLAIEAGDQRLAVDCSLKAAFGDGAESIAGAAREPLAAAELLADRGRHEEAIGLFELARSFRRAAASALALGQSARAARLFERGRAPFEAAVEYEKAELLDDALRLLEAEARRLGRDTPGRLGTAANEQLARVELRRAEVLRKLGKETEAAALLREVRPTSQSVRLLAESGNVREAIEAALQLGDTETAVRLLHRTPDLDRELAARIYLRTGHAVAAGDQFAALGLAREAAEAYESGGDWAKAGSRWEAAGEHERAAEAYLRGRRPRDAGRCYTALGKPQLAAAAYSKAGDHAAAAAQYLKGRQRVAAAAEMVAAGDKAEAARLLTQAADNSPEREAATLLLVPLLLEQGKGEEALHRLRQLPALRPSALTPTADRTQTARDRLYWMARSYEELGRLDQAESCYRELADPTREHRDAAARLAAVRELLRPADAAAGIGAGAGAATPPAGPRLGPAAQAAGAAGVAGAAGAVSGAHTSQAAFPPGAASAPWPGPTEQAPLTVTPRPPVPPPAAGTGAVRAPLDRLSTRSTATQPDAAQADSPPAARATPGSGAAAAIGTLVVGQVLAGRFQILTEIGQGGMGRVYKAHDFELGELVAIKVLSGQPDDGSVDSERLLREVQICRKITHPNVVRVFDLGRHQGSIFIIMELLEGQGLVELIDPDRRPPLAQVKTILTEIASGLQEAHALGVVHRDLKPENVILTATRLKILDFGIARMSGFDKRLTQAGFALGSPLYMSPEQIQGLAIDSRSDLYSLGVLAFALIAGREPFDGANSTAIAIQHLQQQPPDLRAFRPGLPEGWTEVVGKLLAKQPDDRYQTSQDVIAALAPLPTE